jgi:holo-ACP synthase
MERPVSLQEVLDGRDRRAARCRALLEAHRLPVLQATLVVPGPVKDLPECRRLMAVASAQLDAGLRVRGWTVAADEPAFPPTGPERLLAVAAPARDLKRLAVSLEQDQPLGRFWDLDVIDPVSGPVSRRELGLPPRPCLLCGGEARACARSRRHPVAELVAYLKERVHAHAP